MRERFLFVSILILLFSHTSFSQETYEVGMAQASLEPTNEFVSLALAGYAAPWEGRFTLLWKEKGVISPFTGISGGDDCLYFVDGQSLFKGSTEEALHREKMGGAAGIQHITTRGSSIYGITLDGQLKKSDLSKKRFKWKNLGTTDRSVKAIAVAEESLYMADNEGIFWVTRLSSRRVRWERAGFPPLKNVVSLVAAEGQLVALTAEGVLLRQGGAYQENKWIKIGYKNGVTVLEDIKHIAVANNQIYGVDGDNRLYQGGHRSKGELSARALSIKSSGQTVVIIGLDLTGINDTFAASIQEELYKTRGLPASAVFINSSHTHFAPVTQNWLTWQESNRLPDSSYLYRVVRKAVIQAVHQSLDNAQPAELFFGRGNAQLGFNRSLRDRQIGRAVV